MGYTKYTLAMLSEDDVTRMEKSVYETLEDLDIPKIDYEKYLGGFMKKPTKFRLLSGN